MRVLVIGLTGKQAAALRRLVDGSIRLEVVTLERALRLRGASVDLAVATRFVGHKHELHLRSVVRCPVLRVPAGGAEAVARLLRSVATSQAKAA